MTEGPEAEGGPAAPSPAEWQGPPPALALPVLFEDNHLLVIDKPAGLATEAPPPVPESAVCWARAYLREKYGKTGRVYLGVPHRLDRAVSGALVLARQTKSAQRLAEQFRERQVRKLYWAVTTARPQPDEGELVDTLLKRDGAPTVEVVAAGTPGGKEARASYRVLGPCSAGWLLEVDLLTGRNHQIRVQLAQRGWPVVGDALYGGQPGPEALAGSVALHARSLTILHPIRYKREEFTAPVPATWESLGVRSGESHGADTP